MSLLIKALEQAAKDRDASNGDTARVARRAVVEPTLEPPPPPRTPASSSTLEAKRAEASAARDASAEPRASSSLASGLARIEAQQRSRAAAVMQATERSHALIVAYLRSNPIVVIAAAAVLFGIGFGIYVYLQIAHPGFFVPQAATQPRTAPPPPPSAPPSSVPPTLPAATETAASAAASAEPPGRAARASVETADSRPRAAAEPGTTTRPRDASEPVAAPAVRPAIPATAVIASSGEVESRDNGRLAARERPGEAVREPRNERPIEAGRERQNPRAAPEPKRAPVAEAATPAREAIAVSAGRQEPRLSPLLTQAYAALQSGDLALARTLYTRLNQAEPLNVDGLLGLAYIATQEHRTDDAVKHYGRILQLDPRHAVAQAGMIALMGRADPLAAETRLKQLIAREPSAFLHFVLGNLYADQAMWHQAQQAYFQAHHLEPDNADYAFNLAVGLDQLRQTKAALGFYRRAEELAKARGRVNFDLSLARERISALSSRIE